MAKLRGHTESPRHDGLFFLPENSLFKMDGFLRIFYLGREGLWLGWWEFFGRNCCRCK